MLLGTADYRLTIIHAGLNDRGPWRLPQRSLPFFLLSYCLSGEEYLVDQHGRQRIRTGQAFCQAPGEVMDIGSDSGSSPAWVHFQVETPTAPPPIPRPYSRATGPSSESIWGCELPRLPAANLCRRIGRQLPPAIRAWQSGIPLGIARAEQVLAGLLLDLVEHQQPAGGGRSLDERLRLAEQLAEEGMAYGFDVKDFAAAAGFKRSRFHDLYQQARGCSPGAALRRMRFNRACVLLRDTDRSVGEIGRLIGFDDPSAFGRFFAQHAGMRPMVWRQCKGR